MAHPNGMRPRDERGHPVVRDAINRGFLASGNPYHRIPMLTDHDSANEARKIIARALEHFGLGRAAWVTDADRNPCYRDCKDPAAPHSVGFALYRKDGARKFIATQSGGDPSKLKYNPHMRRQGDRFSDDGTWIPAS